MDIQSKRVFVSTMVHVHIRNSPSPPDVWESDTRKQTCCSYSVFICAYYKVGFVPRPHLLTRKNVTCLDTQAQQKGKKFTAAGEVVCNNSHAATISQSHWSLPHFGNRPTTFTFITPFPTG